MFGFKTSGTAFDEVFDEAVIVVVVIPSVVGAVEARGRVESTLEGLDRVLFARLNKSSCVCRNDCHAAILRSI